MTSVFPSLRLSKWFRWDSRLKFKEKQGPGIYVLTISENGSKPSKPWYRVADYIGMTNSNKYGLKGRWRQFEIGVKSGRTHSGAKSMRSRLLKFGKNKWKEQLYVCAQAIPCNNRKKSRKPGDVMKMGARAFLEYAAIVEYKRHHNNKEPPYNKK